MYNHSMRRLTAKDYAKHKSAALALATRKAKQFSELYGVHYNKISIKNQKTMWGSCSRKGNLNFNVKIVLLPEYFQDYIIVHEICHLKEFNHSPRFWALVAQSVPDHKRLRKGLKRML